MNIIKRKTYAVLAILILVPLLALTCIHAAEEQRPLIEKQPIPKIARIVSKPTGQAASITELPDYELLMIANMLPYQDLMNLIRTSKKMRDLLSPLSLTKYWMHPEIQSKKLSNLEGFRVAFSPNGELLAFITGKDDDDRIFLLKCENWAVCHTNEQ